jgi:hypothetical protein
MKFFLVSILLFFSLNSLSQSYSYLGFWNDRTTFLSRPYIYKSVMIRDYTSFNYSSLIGVGVNCLGKPSVMAGFDLELGQSDTKYIAGFGMEVFGWKKYYQDFMPQFRAGIKYKNVMLMGSNNWSFRDTLLKAGWAKKPVPGFSIGLFYVIKSY